MSDYLFFFVTICLAKMLFELFCWHCWDNSLILKFQTLFHLFDFSLFSSQFFVFRLIYFVSIWFPTCFYFFCFQVHDRWPRTEAQERDEGQVHHREGQTQESAKSGSLEKGRAHRVGVRKQRPGLLFFQQFLIGLTLVKDLAVSLKDCSNISHY